jgi:hypothetical protein
MICNGCQIKELLAQKAAAEKDGNSEKVAEIQTKIKQLQGGGGAVSYPKPPTPQRKLPAQPLTVSPLSLIVLPNWAIWMYMI